MTPTELNQLPADQQQNTLLAIALGGYTEEAIVRSTGLKENLAYVPRYSYHVLQDWKPAEDKALMWQLVCELRDYYYKSKNHPADKRAWFWMDCASEQELIKAYIAADPKGLIANWRKENE